MGDQGKATASSRYFCEFLGTFILVVTIGCNVLNNAESDFKVLSIACALAVMILAMGKNSGGHFNPAVTLAAGLTGNTEWSDVLPYFGAQLSGGVLAGFAYTVPSVGVPGAKWSQTGFVELCYTFMLCFVVLNVACSKAHAGVNQFYGIAIGFVVVAGGYAGTGLSLGCFNPAVTFGLFASNAVSGKPHGASFWMAFVYIGFQLCGSILATVCFWLVRPDELPKSRFSLHVLYNPETVGKDGFRGQFPLFSKLVAEFLGTFMLVLTVGFNVLSGSHGGAISIAASLMCMIFALGSVSGAHFNPAVTIAVLCSGRNVIRFSNAMYYIGVQVVAGLFAAFVYQTVSLSDHCVALKGDHTWRKVIAVEFFFTFVLAFTVLSVATVKKALSEYFGFAIGMCVTVGGYAIGSVSGGSLNPAVSFAAPFGCMIFDKTPTIGWGCIIYAVTQLAAGCTAAWAFQVTQPSEYRP